MCVNHAKGESGLAGPKGDVGPYELKDRNGTTVQRGDKGKPGLPGYGGEKGDHGPLGLRGSSVSR